MKSGNRSHVALLTRSVRTRSILILCFYFSQFHPITFAGSYTFAKTLEYKAKQGLNAGKDVTVIPPAEYQERFVSALDGYFLACPG